MMGEGGGGHTYIATYSNYQESTSPLPPPHTHSHTPYHPLGELVSLDSGLEEVVRLVRGLLPHVRMHSRGKVIPLGKYT